MRDFDWKKELPQWALLAAMFAAAALSWSDAPERIPVHWSFSGEVDRYGGKVEGLLMLPLLALGIYVAMLLLPRVDPGRPNYARFGNVYRLLRLGILLVLGVAYGVVILTIHGIAVNVGLVVSLAVGLLFVLLSGILGKVRPNWFVGIRTPWTLTSKRAWVRTHRLGGWIFLALGALVVLAGVLQTGWAFAMMVGGVIAAVGAMFLYSYLIWRKDPDRVSPAGTTPANDDDHAEKSG